MSDKEDRLVEKAANWISREGLEAPAVLLLQMLKPLSTIGGDLALFFLAPYLPMLEEKGYEFIETFQKRENLEKLIHRVEELHEETTANKGSGSSRNPLDWLRNRFRHPRKAI